MTPPTPHNPPLPPGPPPQPPQHHHTWAHDGFRTTHQPQIPQICALLMSEAEAWRALLSLHGVTLHNAQSASKPTTSDAELVMTEESTASDAREAEYCAALSNLASQADALHAECMRVRNLRRARRTAEVEALKEVTRVHSDEYLAIGKHLSSNLAIAVANVTSDIRVCIQQQRTQLSQLKSIVEVIKTGIELPIERDSVLVVGVKKGDDVDARPVEEVLSCLYENSRELNETTLSDTLKRLFTSQQSSVSNETRTFARRSSKR